MKVLLSAKIKNRKGEEFTQQTRTPYYEDEEGVPVEKQRLEVTEVTVGRMLTAALLKKEGEMEEKEIMEKYELFLKLEGSDEIELTDKELEFIKSLVCRIYDIFFAGQIIKNHLIK